MDIETVLHNPGLELLVVLGGVLVLSYAANFFYPRIFLGKWYRYLVTPGVIVHEYSHAIGCVLTGARIKSISVFKEDGGEIVHEPPRVVFGEGVIVVMPIIGAAIALYLLGKLLVPGLVGSDELDFNTWRFLAFAYFAFSLTAAMAPSKQDLKVGLASFIVICLLIGGGAFVPGLNDFGSFLVGDEFDGLLRLILFALVVLLIVTVAGAVTYAILHRTARKGKKYRTV